MNREEYLEFHRRACDKMIDITKKKNADYTGGSDDPFNNFRHIGELVQGLPNVCEIGFLTRMSDKFSRIGSFVAKGKIEVTDESVDDTLLDLANYCVLMLGFITEKRLHASGQTSFLHKGGHHGTQTTGRN